MKKLEKFIEKYLMPIANFTSSNKEISAIKDGMLQVMPLMIVGSLILIITNFPFINQILPGVDLWGYIGKIFDATMGLTACFALVAIASNYSEKLEINAVYGTIAAFASYFVLTNFFVVNEGVTIKNVLSLSAFSAESLFTIIIITLVSIRIYSFCVKKNIVIKMPKEVPANVAASFSSMIPIAITVAIMLVVQKLFALTSFETFHNFVYKNITMSLMGFMDLKYSSLFMNLFGQILWFFGLHGGIILIAVFGPIMQQMTLANVEAFKLGQALPYVNTNPFQYVYIIGGAGGILAAIVATYIVGKSKHAKSISKISIVPALFNIQEPFHFGFSTFMNPILFIPYVFVPVMISFVSYTLIQIGFAPVPVIDISWTVPIFLSGFISTNYNIMGMVTQVITFTLSVLFWIPFIRIADKENIKREKELAEK